MPLPQPIFDGQGYALARIDDRTLAAFVAVAHKAQTAERLDDSEAALLAFCAESIGQELIQRRRAAETIADLASGNVLLFPAEAAT